MPFQVTYVENDLLSSSVETLLAFEHLFDTDVTACRVQDARSIEPVGHDCDRD